MTTNALYDVGTRVYLPGTAEQNKYGEWGDNIGGTIGGYAMLPGPGGSHTYYVVYLDHRDCGWVGSRRFYITEMVVHPDNVKQGRP